MEMITGNNVEKIQQVSMDIIFKSGQEYWPTPKWIESLFFRGAIL